jgi:hypothetical protein
VSRCSNGPSSWSTSFKRVLPKSKTARRAYRNGQEYEDLLKMEEIGADEWAGDARDIGDRRLARSKDQRQDRRHRRDRAGLELKIGFGRFRASRGVLFAFSGKLRDLSG